MNGHEIGETEKKTFAGSFIFYFYFWLKPYPGQ